MMTSLTNNQLTLPTETKQHSEDTSSMFYQSVFPRPTTVPPNHFQRTISLSADKINNNPFDHWEQTSGKPRADCKHEKVEWWNLNKCASCDKFFSSSGPTIGLQEGKQPEFLQLPERYAEEQEWKQKVIAQDKAYGDSVAHGKRSYNSAIRLDALIAIAYDHNCWYWPTWRVVRDLIQPATCDTRCRFCEISEMQDYIGPADVFLSHCWSAPFGDLIGAASQGAKKSRYIWADIFAVRQWGGNDADHVFRKVIKRSKALILSVSPVERLKQPFNIKLEEHLKYFASLEGKAARKMIPVCRLWCAVELSAAAFQEKPIVIKGGYVSEIKNDGTMEYISTEMGATMNTLYEIVDLKSTECVSKLDYDREMSIILSQPGGIESVNKTVKGACLSASFIETLFKGCNSVYQPHLNVIDAAVCGEVEALQNLAIFPDSQNVELGLTILVLGVAAAGGREKIVATLLELLLTSEDTTTHEEAKEEEDISFFACCDHSAIALRNSPNLNDRSEDRLALWPGDCIPGTLTTDGNWICVKSTPANSMMDSLSEIRSGKFFPMRKDGVGELLKKVSSAEYKNILNNNWLSDVVSRSSSIVYAIMGYHLGVLKLLLRVRGKVKGLTPVNRITSAGEIPLGAAVKTAQLDMVQLLLSTDGIDINKRNGHGMTPLIIACSPAKSDCSDAHIAIVSALLTQNGIDVNLKSADGKLSPLATAIAKGNTEIVRLLIGSNVNINEGIAGMTPLKIAMHFKHTNIAQMLCSAGAHDTLHDAAARNDVGSVSRILSETGTDLNSVDTWGNSALFLACKLGHTEMVDLLTRQSGIEVNKAQQMGCTPFFMACANGNIDVVKRLLLTPGVDLNKGCVLGSSPLGVARAMGRQNVVELLSLHFQQRPSGGK
jgi:ankyrin repeat protein